MDNRIESRIDRQTDGCWIWTGSTDRDGYGFAWWEKKRRRAHRVVYELLRGPIPDGLVIDHLCRTPSCVNPEHLEPVTHRTNTLRGENFIADQVRRTHCRMGHPLDEKNTYVRREGFRQCRECMNKAGREWRARQRAKPAAG